MAKITGWSGKDLLQKCGLTPRTASTRCSKIPIKWEKWRRMKCVYCGQDEEEKKFEVLDSIADVLRDILEELKKMNELTEGK